MDSVRSEILAMLEAHEKAIMDSLDYIAENTSREDFRKAAVETAFNAGALKGLAYLLGRLSDIPKEVDGHEDEVQGE